MFIQVARFLSPFLPPASVPLAVYLVYIHLAETGREQARRYVFEAASVVFSALCLYVVATHVYKDQPPGVVPRHVGAAFLRDNGNSFPSHHAIFVALLTAMVALASLRLTRLFFALTMIEDAALVIGGYHSVADVAAGNIVVWLPTVCVLLLRVYSEHASRHQPTAQRLVDEHVALGVESME